MTNQPILYSFRTAGHQRRQRIIFIRNVFIAAFAFIGFVAALSVVIPFVLDAAEREAQWRAERLCEQGYYCDPKAGP